MTTDEYRFRIGAIDALVVADMSAEMTMERFAGIFSGADAQELIEAFAKLEAPMFSRNCLFINAPSGRVLVDTGEGRIIPRLAQAGVQPEDIDLVIITHFHGDHVGGLVTADSAATFPNARVVVSRLEWQHWTSEAVPEDRRQGIEKLFAPYVGRVTMVEDGDAISPEIRAVLMAGHTPGQMGLHVTSDGSALLHIADAAHFPLQADYPHCSPRFDSDPQQAVATRRGLFERAAGEGTLLLAYHFPYPGVGRFTRSAAGYQWHPQA